MSMVALLFTAVALAMDAFAVSVCQGLGMRKLRCGQMVIIGLYFGIFQALMPLLGWLLGTSFSRYIYTFDHWIAFVLLELIGGKMLWEVLHTKEAATAATNPGKLNHRELLLLAVATSIDALAVGIAFACLAVDIVSSVVYIGVITFVISVAGVWMGSRFGNCFRTKAEIAGAVVLMLIGIKILADHLLRHS